MSIPCGCMLVSSGLFFKCQAHQTSLQRYSDHEMFNSYLHGKSTSYRKKNVDITNPNSGFGMWFSQQLALFLKNYFTETESRIFPRVALNFQAEVLLLSPSLRTMDMRHYTSTLRIFHVLLKGTSLLSIAMFSWKFDPYDNLKPYLSLIKFYTHFLFCFVFYLK